MALPRTYPRLNNTSIVFLALIALLIAQQIDEYTGVVVVSSLYALPILIITFRFGTKGISAASLITALAYVSETLYEHMPFFDWLVGLIGILLVYMLALQMNWQRMATNKRSEELKEARDQLRVFMGSVSHDLSQPLTLIKTYAQILIKDAAGKNSAALKKIDSTADFMTSLVNDLREASRIGSGQFTVVRRPADLSKILRDAIAAEQYGPRHEVTSAIPADITGEFDTVRLRQLFSNLISNAVKYSPQGGKITIELAVRSEKAVISITDQGLGISPDMAEKLFQPFSRLPNSSSIKGTGLGLYISKAIAEAHGGTITVASMLGKGTTFTVNLPL